MLLSKNWKRMEWIGTFLLMFVTPSPAWASCYFLMDADCVGHESTCNTGPEACDGISTGDQFCTDNSHEKSVVQGGSFSEPTSNGEEGSGHDSQLPMTSTACGVKYACKCVYNVAAEQFECEKQNNQLAWTQYWHPADPQAGSCP